VGSPLLEKSRFRYTRTKETWARGWRRSLANDASDADDGRRQVVAAAPPPPP